MRFGIVILPEYRWAEARHLWRRAEEYGFDHAWTYDRPPEDEEKPEPPATGGASEPGGAKAPD